MQIQIKAHFNKQTKDSKKEQVQFYVTGEDEKRPELNQLTREVVILQIEGLEGVELTSEFKKCSKDSKKTVLEFEVKGDSSAAQTFEFYKMAGSDVVLYITESQMDIDEFREAQEQYREGVRGKINQDGTIDVEDKNQLTMDEVATSAEGDEDGPKMPDDLNEDELPF